MIVYYFLIFFFSSYVNMEGKKSVYAFCSGLIFGSLLNYANITPFLLGAAAGGFVAYHMRSTTGVMKDLDSAQTKIWGFLAKNHGPEKEK